MALDTYLAKTAKLIVEDCERLARYPKLDLDPSTGDPPLDGFLDNAFAYKWLNDILRETYILFDWPGTQKALQIQLTARSQALPRDFWRLQFDNGIIIAEDNSRRQMTNCTREKFFVGMTDDEQRRRPERFYIDRTRAGSLFVDPIPDHVYLAEIHYYALKTKLDSIEDIIDFPHDKYIFLCLLEKYYLDQDDARVGVVNQQKMMHLQEIRGIAFDTREQDSNSFWDTRFFSSMPWEYE